MDQITHFHEHLDLCRQCKDHPFDLCVTGLVLLAETVRGLSTVHFLRYGASLCGKTQPNTWPKGEVFVSHAAEQSMVSCLTCRDRLRTLVL